MAFINKKTLDVKCLWNTSIINVRNCTCVNPALVCVCVYLHYKCVCLWRHTLQCLIGAAASTAAQRYTRRDEEVMCLPRELPPNFHQRLSGMTSASLIHIQPPHHWERERENQWITLRKTHPLFMECSGFSTESVTSYWIIFTLMHSTRIIRQPASSLI